MRSPSHYSRLLRWTLHHYLPEHDVTIETANGRLSVSSKDWLMGKQLFVRQNYEIEFIDMTVEFLRQSGYLKAGTNGTAVDIGANLGMIGIALARRRYFNRILAFEPGPRNFRLLRKNVEQNGLQSRIDCFNVALSSADGEIEFEIDAGNSGDSRVRETVQAGELREHLRETVRVHSRSFDSVLREAGNADDIDMFWIDIQGHEGRFFAGAREFFKGRHVPVVNEFWGYGIARSGMSREEYCEVVQETFSKFYLHTEDGYQEKPIAEIDSLFDKYQRPREIASFILV